MVILGKTQSNLLPRDPCQGAILLVVLLVMVVLIGVGMTGLLLTSNSVQMSSNITMRNQALVVAEAGIERARQILNFIPASNPNWVPAIQTLLQGQNPSNGDEIPSSAEECSGLKPPSGTGTISQKRGAVLMDSVTHGCTSSTPCKLSTVTYPQLVTYNETISGFGTSLRPNMGHYTVYIRQDQADCRMNNFTCENSPLPITSDGGIADSGMTPCTPPVGAPTPNGAIVVRSEGVASDERTRVVLEVTLAPAQSLSVQTNATLSSLCSSGANGCEDNSSVHNGLTVNSPIAYGGASAGGATGTGGSGAGGTTSSGGTSGGGGVTSGGTTTGGITSTGGSTSTGGTTSTGGSTGCVFSKCSAVATMGISYIGHMNFSGSTVTETGTELFDAWLNLRAAPCATPNIDITTTTITDALLAPYKLILVLDLFHTPADRNAYIASQTGGPSAPNYFTTGTQRTLQASEATAIKNWVNNGGGLGVIMGFSNRAAESNNDNLFLRQFGVTYSSLTNNTAPGGVYIMGSRDIDSGLSHTAPIASVINNGVDKVKLVNGTAIRGWNGSAEVNLPANSPTFATYAAEDGWVVGIAFKTSSGRVVMWGDEWVTYNMVYGSTSWKAAKLWTNIFDWLSQACIP
jgi:hypothetical protein